MQRVSSCIEKMGALLILEAMVDAIIKAKGFGYNFILLLSDSWRPVLVSNRKCRPSWQEKVLVEDGCSIAQIGLVYYFVCVLKVVIGNVSFLAKLATEMLVDHCMFRTLLYFSSLSKKKKKKAHTLI